MLVNIVTFNGLSSAYSNSETYPKLETKYLSNQFRFELFKNHLREWTNKDYIILLQELSLSWSNELILFFEQFNYKFVYTHYGNKYNDFMGIGIAYPHSYKTLKTEIFCVGDKIKLPFNVKKYKDYYSFSKFNVFKFIYSVFYSNVINYHKNIHETYNNAMRKYNRSIFITLQKDNCVFNVMNYHMPCEFKTPLLQKLHFDILVKYIAQINNITILGGDFNITPESEVYRYVENVHDLVSLYKEKHDKEPKFTINSESSFGGYFKNTLDYFFIKKDDKNYHNIRILSIDTMYDVDKFYPNELCSSDHVPLQVTFEI